MTDPLKCPTCLHRVDVVAPKRAVEVVLSIGADDMRTAIAALREAADEAERTGSLGNSCTGGYSFGRFVTVTDRPEQTHDRYFEELEAHLAAERAEETAKGGAP